MKETLSTVFDPAVMVVRVIQQNTARTASGAMRLIVFESISLLAFISSGMRVVTQG